MPELVLFSAWEQRHSAASLMEMFPAAVDEGMAEIAENKKSEKVKGGDADNGEAPKKSVSGDEDIIEVGDAGSKSVDGEEGIIEVGDEKSGPVGGKSEIQKRPSLSIVQAFYVVMGGLTLNVRDIHGRRTLTPQGLLFFARRGCFFDIPEDTIRDKSKADILAKGLVCCQVTWVVIQCIARKASGLPVTLLEVHTMVHVVCALSMYALWFYKPLDVKYPIADGSISLLFKESTLSRVHPGGGLSVLSHSIRDDADTRAIGLWGDCLFWNRSRNVFLWAEGHVGFGGMGQNPGWNLPGVQLLLLLIVASLSAAYGGVHAAAWRFLFPSPVEHLLWKVSCMVCIAGSIPASIAVMAIADAWSFKPSQRRERLWLDWGHGLHAIPLVICVITLLVFIVARFFMVIEAFLSLRHTTIGSYATVTWALYIPHF
ncbi:MAG: hypothetical protein M1839_004775 [Geoglossum umbratile]|nr:MAG: hypothetical protein M1839_004775 [Geoglossum umbratile]